MARSRLNPSDATLASEGDAKPGERPSNSGGALAADGQHDPTAAPEAHAEHIAARDETFVVAPGRTLTVGQSKRTLRPGDAVSLCQDEMRKLLTLGFIVPSAQGNSEGGGVSVGGLKVVGGRRPGGVVA